MKKLILILLTLIFISIPSLLYSGIKYSMTGIGIGARANVLHSSFVAVADDYTAAFWNPAGMALMDNMQFGAMLYRLPLNRNVGYLGMVYPAGENRFGIAWTNLAIDGLQGRSGNTAEPDYLFSNNDQELSFSYARLIFDKFGFGVNARGLYHSIDNVAAIGYALDFGLIWQFYHQANVGLMFNNIGSKLHWIDSKHQDCIQKTVTLAGSYRLDNLLVAIGIETDYSEQRLKYRFSGGAEFNAMDLFFVRAGLHDSRLSVGLGAKWNVKNFDISVNYAAMSSKLSSELGHCCEVGFAWNKPINDQTVGARRNVPLLQKSKPAEKPHEIKSLINEIRVVQITGDRVNVRKGPGLIYLVIGQALRHQIFQLIDEHENWYQINYNGQIGWIEKSFAKIK